MAARHVHQDVGPGRTVSGVRPGTDGASEPIVPVVPDRGAKRPRERLARAAGNHGRRRRSGHLDDPPGVGGSEVNLHVACHRRKSNDRHVGDPEREQQRERIVDAGVRVDDEGAHAMIDPTSQGGGSPMDILITYCGE